MHKYFSIIVITILFLAAGVSAAGNSMILWAAGIAMPDNSLKIRLFDKSLSGNDNFYAFLSRGYYLTENGLYEKAGNDFNSAIKLKPLDCRPWLGLARMEAKRGNQELSYKYLRRAEIEAPLSPMTYLTASEFHKKDGHPEHWAINRIRYLKLSGNLSKAEELAEESIIRFPDSTRFLEIKGDIRYQKKDYNAAAEAYRKIHELALEYAWPYLKYAEAVMMLGDEAGALASIDRAIMYDPSFYQAYAARAEIYLKRGDKSKFSGDFLRAGMNMIKVGLLRDAEKILLKMKKNKAEESFIRNLEDEIRKTHE